MYILRYLAQKRISTLTQPQENRLSLVGGAA